MGLIDRLLGRETKAAPAQTPLAFAVIDVETTGLSPYGDRIVEIALVRLSADGRAVDQWDTRINPEGPVSATHIHGITDADVAGKPPFRSVAPQLSALLAGLPVVAHNAPFDLAFLRAEFERAGWDMPWLPSFCTLDGSYEFLPDLQRRRLVDCCWAAGIAPEHAHSALGDAEAAAGLFAHYLSKSAGTASRQELDSLTQRAHSVSWPSGPVRPPTAWVPDQKASGRPRPTRITASRPKHPALVAQLSDLTLAEVVDEGAPNGTLTYLETLLAAVEDGEISPNESEALSLLADVYKLNAEEVARANEAFILALAHRALADGHVDREERAELHGVAELIGVAKAVVLGVIDRADGARSARMSAQLAAIPADWQYGEPLRVGEKVVFTGCDEIQRERLEARAEELGVRVVGGVSRLTAMLVTDGGFDGTKAARARELGTRQVHPDLFEVLLQHLQPALPPVAAQAEATSPYPATERRPSASDVRASGSPSQIRTWALANGFQVGVRGRLGLDVLDAYSRAMQPQLS